MKKVVRGNTFCGNPISEYGQKNRYVDYATLAKAFDAVLCNEIMNVYSDHWEIVNGSDYDEENDEYTEIYQYYIISDSGAKVLEYWTDEIVYYNIVFNISYTFSFVASPFENALALPVAIPIRKAPR